MAQRGSLKIHGYAVTKRKRDFRAVGCLPETSGREFSVSEVEPGRWKASRTTSNGERVRRRFLATDAGEAVLIGEGMLYGVEEPEGDPSTFPVSKVFSDWIESLSIADKTRKEYRYAVKQFLLWLDKRRVTAWGELKPSDLQRYANEKAAGGLQRNSVRLATFPVVSCSRWASREYDLKDLSASFKLPKCREETTFKDSEVALTLPQAAEFILWLRDQPKGWEVLPAVCLMGLCALRLTEAVRLKWGNVDLRAGTVTIQGQVKNKASVRRIPIPALVHMILEEAPKEFETIVSPRFTAGDWGPKEFGLLVKGFLREWDPSVLTLASNLRDILQTTGELEGWAGFVLDSYVGHTGNSIRRKHYTKPNQETLMRLMREQVTTRVDSLIDPIHKKWVERDSRVVRLA